jgi:hypothetical protein
MPKGKLTKVGDLLQERKLERLSHIIDESFAMEVEAAREAGALGFMVRTLAQATMPHKRPDGTRFIRTNGSLRLEMVALQSDIGLPYGSVPRLLMAWICTEAVRTQSSKLYLGSSLSDFMGQLGMVPTGGRWGTITRLRYQALRLFNTAISCRFTVETDGVLRKPLHNVLVADEYEERWWKPKDPNQGHLAYESELQLNERFFREILEFPVPIDLRALKALTKSPMAIDQYVWLSYRLGYLRKQTTIPWPALQAQFGAEYARTRDFKAAFTEHLKAVLQAYKSARVESGESGLILKPSPTHVARQVGGSSL